MDGSEVVVPEGDVPASGEVVLARQGNLLVLQGPRDLVEKLTSNEPVLGDRAQVQTRQCGALGALASLASLMPSGGMHQQVFKLDSRAMAQLQSGQLAQAADGSLGLVARGSNGRFLEQGKLLPVEFNPTDALDAQMALMTLALTSAIAEVADAVERVEDKVDRLSDLLDSERVGAIVGANRSLTRRAQLAGADGFLTTTDWSAIDDVGVQVEQQIESLRSFVRKRLSSAEDRGDAITDRHDAIGDVQDLGEALDLLVIAQDSLYLFQQLRLFRIRDTEPSRLATALDEAKSLMDGHEAEDAGLLARVRQVVAERATVDALEIYRFITTGSLVGRAAEVDETLNRFATQRTLAYKPIDEVEVPGINDAISELRGRGSNALSDGQRIASGVVNRVRSRNDHRSALKPGDEIPALPETTEEVGKYPVDIEAERSSTDRFRSRFTKVRRGAFDRINRRPEDDQREDHTDDDIADV